MSLDNQGKTSPLTTSQIGFLNGLKGYEQMQSDMAGGRYESEVHSAIEDVLQRNGDPATLLKWGIEKSHASVINVVLEHFPETAVPAEKILSVIEGWSSETKLEILARLASRIPKGQQEMVRNAYRNFLEHLIEKESVPNNFFKWAVKKQLFWIGNFLYNRNTKDDLQLASSILKASGSPQALILLGTIKQNAKENNNWPVSHTIQTLREKYEMLRGPMKKNNK